MKCNSSHKLFAGGLTLLFCAAINLHAGGGFGGGGGAGGGGFGGAGGGGFGGGGGGRGGGTGSSTYNNNGTVGSAVIQVDPNTHTLIVIADKVTAAQIQTAIASLDAAQPQVLIKVVFLQVELNNASEIGVQGNYTGNFLGNSLAQLTGYTTNYSLIPGTPSVVPTAINPTTGATTAYGLNPGTPTTAVTGLTPAHSSGSMANNFGLPVSLPSVAGPGGVYSVLGNDFTATIQAVASAGKAQVLARPSILARDGQMATITIGQSIYLPSGVTYATAGGTATVTPTINGSYQSVGIILNVTPFIGKNGLVEMILQPQDSSVDTSTPGQIIAFGNTSILNSSPVYAPNIDITSANTVVVTPDGQPVVIGGLIEHVKSSADSKIPFLGDIPFIGQLFKASSKADTKQELLLFLTPHIVESPIQLARFTNPEMGQAPLMTNLISEPELDRFLERVPIKPAKNSN